MAIQKVDKMGVPKAKVPVMEALSSMDSSFLMALSMANPKVGETGGLKLKAFGMEVLKPTGFDFPTALSTVSRTVD